MAKTDRTDLFSNRVRIFSFILTVLVIWIHAVQPSLVYPEGTAGAGLWIMLQRVLGTYLGQIAVPGFFALSGYLFFRNADRAADDPAAYFGAKLKSRVRTLAVPYLLWNLIYYMIYLAAGRAELSVPFVLKSIFLYYCNPVFWYLKQLIVITALAPVLWLLLIKDRSTAPVLVGLFFLAVFYDLLPVHPVNEDALFYYACGTAAALHCRTFVENTAEAGIAVPKRWRRIMLCSAAAFFLLHMMALWGAKYGFVRMSIAGAVGCRICGIIALFALLSSCGAGTKRTPKYMEYNFFVYATHYLELRLVQKIAGAAGSGPLVSSLLYLLMPGLCICLSVAAGRIMQKYAPAAFRLLTGGRD